jgi:DNA-binding SARP family transcriptional activator
MRLSLFLLGTFDVRHDGRPVSNFRSQQARALLAYLAIEADRPHAREHLCALLWPDEPLQAALTNLRQTLHHLREAIEPPGEEGRYLLLTRHSVQLNPAALRCDVAIFYAALSAVEAHRHYAAASCGVCVEHLRAALELWRGELLPGFSFDGSSPFKEWLLVERERLRNQLFSLLDILVAHHERCDETSMATALLRRWLALEPWHEEAHLRLMAALARAGQRTLALRQFERYRVSMAADLGAEPSPAALRLVALVRSGELARAGDEGRPAWATRSVGL